MSDPQKLLNEVEDGRLAAILLPNVEALTAREIETVIVRATGAFDGGKLDPTAAVALWGQVAAFRKLKFELEHRMRKGTRAQHALSTPPA